MRTKITRERYRGLFYERAAAVRGVFHERAAVGGPRRRATGK